jgi:hypothetical protein
MLATKSAAEKPLFPTSFLASWGVFFSTTISTRSRAQISLFLTDLGGICRGCRKIIRKTHTRFC